MKFGSLAFKVHVVKLIFGSVKLIFGSVVLRMDDRGKIDIWFIKVDIGFTCMVGV